MTRTDNDSKHEVMNGEPQTTNSRHDTSVSVEESDPVAGEMERPADESEGEGDDQLGKLIVERDEFLDQLQRTRADFANFRRRNDQERAMVRQIVGRDVLSQFLPVIDDLDRALAAIPESERESGWVKGVSMIQLKLSATVERLGVTKVEALNKPFDPAFHEAVASEPGTAGSHVVEIYQNGYQLGDLLVRPAMVKTGDAPADDQAAVSDEQTFDA